MPSPVFAWGKTGHRVVAAIADTQLSGLARAHIEEILGRGESLDEAANWPDEMRSAPGEFWQKTSPSWHFVDFNGIVYDRAPPEGDALEAVEHFASVLKDPKASLTDKQTALRFVVHLVGDLHQPLHVGRPGDEGGGKIAVTFFGKPTNLHVVWDSEMPDFEQLSFSEFAAKLERHISNRQLIDWWDVNPKDWVSETAQVREQVYADLPRPKKLVAKPKKREKPLADVGYSYIFKFQPVMERQLSKAGVRLAAYLNAIFAEPQPLPLKTDRN
ncbi:MAG: S1/P1 nuclease [Sphingomonas sp.]